MRFNLGRVQFEIVTGTQNKLTMTKPGEPEKDITTPAIIIAGSAAVFLIALCCCARIVF